jgi:hypothetical protein
LLDDKGKKIVQIAEHRPGTRHYEILKALNYEISGEALKVRLLAMAAEGIIRVVRKDHKFMVFPATVKKVA